MKKTLTKLVSAVIGTTLLASTAFADVVSWKFAYPGSTSYIVKFYCNTIPKGSDPAFTALSHMNDGWNGWRNFIPIFPEEQNFSYGYALPNVTYTCQASLVELINGQLIEGPKSDPVSKQVNIPNKIELE